MENLKIELTQHPKKKPGKGDKLADYRWLLEEYRISLFAQELRTAEPASPKRLDTLWENVKTD